MNYQSSVFILILHNSQILLQRNLKWGDYSFVGGKLEKEEAPLNGAYREIEEELFIQKNIDFLLQEFSPSYLELEKISKRTQVLTRYKIYLFYLTAQRNFLNQIRSENVWIPIADIKNGTSAYKVSDIVSEIIPHLNLDGYDSFKNVI